MVKLSKESGADIVKIQKRHVPTFYSKLELKSYYKSPFGNTLGEYRNGVELDDMLMKVFIDACKENEILWSVSVLDFPSFEFISKYDPLLIKLPSTISNHRNYLSKISKTVHSDIVISTGYTDKEYEKFILKYFSKIENLFLLQCVSSYPAPPDSVQISVVRHYDKLRSFKYPNIIPGYSSHDVGNLASQLAVAAGARMIEKHVKIGNLEWVHFDGVALDLEKNNFKNFVNSIREASLLCGDENKRIHESEHHKYKPNEENN